MPTDRRFQGRNQGERHVNIALLDDAFDVPKFNENDYSVLYDFGDRRRFHNPDRG